MSAHTDQHHHQSCNKQFSVSQSKPFKDRKANRCTCSQVHYWTGEGRLAKPSSSRGNRWSALCQVIDCERHRDPGKVSPIDVDCCCSPSDIDFLFFSPCLSELNNVSRYRTVLGDTVHTDTLFSSCSLRGLEEVLFPQTAQVGSSSAAATGTSSSNSSGAWDAYWERNEPLRDVDEVAIPVLSVCAQDDPVRGETQSTVPLELFETNPHFFLLLTNRGGHCGFSTLSDGSSTGAFGAAGSVAAPNAGTVRRWNNWSHRALLEFFRATTDFFAAEERAKQLAARRRGLGGGTGGRVFRHRSVSTCKQVPGCSHNIHAIYNWQRSYTR